MTIIIDHALPEKGKVDLKVDRSFEIRVSAEEARRQVNRWLLNEVSYLMGADTPILVIKERVIWQVPAWIGFPNVGRVGTVGMIEVDVETGEMDDTSERQAELKRQAKKLAAQLPPYQAKCDVPAEYLARNVPPAPKLVLPDEDEETLVTTPTNR